MGARFAGWRRSLAPLAVVVATAFACHGGPSSSGVAGGGDAGASDDGGDLADTGAPDSGYPPGAPHVSWFRAVASDYSGITATASQSLGHTDGTGIAVGDIDGDGRPDIVAPTAFGTTFVYQNLGELRFKDVTASSGVDGHDVASGATLCDLDGDGDLDLLLAIDSQVTGGNLLFYRNDGHGTFTDRTAAAGLTPTGSARTVVCTDLDGDGLLDVYVADYGFIGSTGFLGVTSIPGRADAFFRNRGDGTFVDLASRLGFDSEGLTWTVAASDYDGDGDLNLYVANDTLAEDDGTRPFDYDSGLEVVLPTDLLYRNDGPGSDGYPVFTEVSASAGAVVTAPRSSMGIVAADMTGDGIPDYYVSNYGRKALLAGVGDGTFTDRTADFGLEAIERYAGPDGNCSSAQVTTGCLLVSWGSAFEDFDLDGNRDLVLANGGLNGTEQPQATWRGGPPQAGPGGAFVPVQTDLPWTAGRAIVAADLDGDGDLDLVLTTLNGPVELFENVAYSPDAGAGASWIAVTPKSQTSAPEGRGALVTVNGMSKTVGAGGDVYSGAPAEARFGLGGATSATVDVLWPSGFTSHLASAPANQVLTVLEPKLVTLSARVSVADGISTVVVTVTPAKPDGSLLGPGAAVTIDATAGTWKLPVLDVGDGSYTRVLVAPLATALSAVKVTVNGTPLKVYPRVEFR